VTLGHKNLFKRNSPCLSFAKQVRNTKPTFKPTSSQLENLLSLTTTSRQSE